MSKQTERKGRLKSPTYRRVIGAGLRLKRQVEGYSLNDILTMTTIPIKTLSQLESGVTTNIDYYVLYAQAVKYNFPSLIESGIKLKPLKALPPEKIQKKLLTKKIRENIILTNFLGTGQSSDIILNELVRLNLIKPDEVTTTNVSGVMRNFLEDGIVKVAFKKGRKHFYMLSQKS